MMKQSLYILTTIILMIASFIYGARFGAEIFITSDAKFQAGLATANLIRLDQLEDLYVKKIREKEW